MTKETAKAIADVSKKINEVELKLNKYIDMQLKQTNNSLQDSDMAIFELAQLISPKEET